MGKVEDLGMKLDSELNNEREIVNDLFNSKKNTEYLEGIVKDIKSGKAHFEEHDLLED